MPSAVWPPEFKKWSIEDKVDWLEANRLWLEARGIKVDAIVESWEAVLDRDTVIRPTFQRSASK